MGGLMALLLAAASPSTACIAAAERMLVFMVQEAVGTRHEAQFKGSMGTPEARAAKLREIAGNLNDDQCAFLLAAPDSTIRALAVSALPERGGN